MAEEEFSAKAFAGELADEEEEFQTEHPLSCKELVFVKRKTERCRASSDHNQNFVLRSHAHSLMTRVSLLLRTIRFMFPSIWNISVLNGVT